MYTVIKRPPEVQKAGRLADNPKRQSLVGGGLERATLPFSGFQRAEPFGGYEVEKKKSRKKCVYKLRTRCYTRLGYFIRVQRGKSA